MTPEGNDAMNKIAAAYGAILDLGDGLKCNTTELVCAVHVLQSFVKQYELYVREPDYWNDWFTDGD